MKYQIAFGIAFIILLMFVCIVIANIWKKKQDNRLIDENGKLTKKGIDKELKRLNEKFESEETI